MIHDDDFFKFHNREVDFISNTNTQSGICVCISIPDKRIRVFCLDKKHINIDEKLESLALKYGVEINKTEIIKIKFKRNLGEIS